MGTWSSIPIKVQNLDTGEVYRSLLEAGFKLGYMSAVKVPAVAYENDVEFIRRGVRLKLVTD